MEKVKAATRERRFGTKHNNDRNMAGENLLHVACREGDLDLLRHLIGVVRETGGDESVVAFVNGKDTSENRVTPLILAARSGLGHTQQRVALANELIQCGADVTAQDASGDNCLHWAVRKADLPIVRFLLQGVGFVTHAVAASNCKLQTPVDIAEQQLRRKNCLWTREIHGLLRAHLSACRVRTRIQNAIRANEKAAHEAHERLHARNLKASDETRRTLAGVRELCDRLLEEANRARKAQEDAFTLPVRQAAEADAHQWLDTPDGRDWIDMRIVSVKRSLMQQVHSGVIKAPKNLKRAAVALVRENYIDRKVKAAGERALAEFAAAAGEPSNSEI